MGAALQYLGISMVVVKSGEARLLNMPWSDQALWVAGPLVCEYVDGHGVVRAKEFAIEVAIRCLPNSKDSHPELGES